VARRCRERRSSCYSRCPWSSVVVKRIDGCRLFRCCRKTSPLSRSRMDSPEIWPKIWKRYVDDTFTMLDWDRVDVFLQHLNSQQPSMRHTQRRPNVKKLWRATSTLWTVCLIIFISSVKRFTCSLPFQCSVRERPSPSRRSIRSIFQNLRAGY